MIQPLKRGIRIPRKSVKLAEETGIHIGDGNLSFHKSVGKNHWSYTHTSHSEEEDYRNFVKNLMFELYQIEPYQRKYGNCVNLTFTRKDLVLFKKNLGLPVGNKKEIKIPQWIMVNERFKVACLRGIFDTDGGLRFTNRNKDEIYRYPQLSLTSYSLSLINDVKIALDELKIKYSNYVEKPNPKKGRPNPIYIIAILGEKRLDQFMKEIGLRNKKHLDKYNFWKKNGYCLPDYLRKNGDGGI